MEEDKVTIREVYKLIKESQDEMSKTIKDGFEGIHHRQDTTNGKVLENTAWRQKTTGSIQTFKWLFGFLGIGNLVMFLKSVLGLF